MAQITKIVNSKEDIGEVKLIAFRFTIPQRKNKPIYTADTFADYYPLGKRLTIYNFNNGKSIKVDSWREAIKHILSL